MDYSVDFSVLDEAARAASFLGTDIAHTLQEMRLDDVPAAIPGGRSANAALRLHAQWDGENRLLMEGMARHAEALEQTAAYYRLTEQQGESAIQQFFEGLGR